MANVVTLGNLRTYIPYVSSDMSAWLEALSKNLPPSLKFADNLSMFVSSTLTNTAVAVKASAGSVHGMFIQSTGALGYLSLWNVAQGSVTVGTTSQDFTINFTATSGQSTACYLGGSGVNGLYGTAITAAIATTARGAAAVGSLPLVIIAYS